MRKRVAGCMVGAAVALMAATAAPARAESVSSLVAEGNRLYKERHLSEAIEIYRRAQRLDPASPGIHYNIGNALYQQGQFDKAYDEYRQAFAAREKELAEGARFNAGNSHLARRNWSEAIRSYQEALSLDPSDRDAKKNLELALAQLLQERKKKPQSKREGQQGQQPPKPPDPNQRQEPQQQEQGQGDDQKNKTEQPAPRQSEERRGGGGRKEKLSREEAARILNAMKDSDKGNKDLLRTPAPDGKPERDW